MWSTIETKNRRGKKQLRDTTVSSPNQKKNSLLCTGREYFTEISSLQCGCLYGRLGNGVADFTVHRSLTPMDIVLYKSTLAQSNSCEKRKTTPGALRSFRMCARCCHSYRLLRFLRAPGGMLLMRFLFMAKQS